MHLFIERVSRSPPLDRRSLRLNLRVGLKSPENTEKLLARGGHVGEPNESRGAVTDKLQQKAGLIAVNQGKERTRGGIKRISRIRDRQAIAESMP